MTGKTLKSGRSAAGYEGIQRQSQMMENKKLRLHTLGEIKERLTLKLFKTDLH